MIDFKNAKVVDAFRIDSYWRINAKICCRSKKLNLKHLSADCLALLDNAKGMIEVNVMEEPKYHIADNKLG